MPDYVRVKDNTTGAKFSQPVGAPLDGVTELKQPAVDDGGNPLPAEFPSDGQQADSKKEKA